MVVLQADCAISHVPGIASYFCSFLHGNNYGFAWLHNCKGLTQMYSILLTQLAQRPSSRAGRWVPHTFKDLASLVFLLSLSFSISLSSSWLQNDCSVYRHGICTPRLEPEKAEGKGLRQKVDAPWGYCCKALSQESQPVASAYILFSRTGIDGCS